MCPIQIRKQLICCIVVFISTAAVSADNFSGQIEKAKVFSVMQAVADWQMKQPEEPEPLDWLHGALYSGFVEFAKISPDGKYIAEMKRVGEKNGWNTGPNKYDADDYIVGRMYLELYCLYCDSAMIKPLKKQFEYILEHPVNLEYPSRTDLGKGFYDRWNWCDALFMGPPVWAKMAKVTGEKKYLDFMDRGFTYTTQKLYDVKEHLYYRDYRYILKRTGSGKKVFWSRGNGWVMAGLAMVLNEMPQDYPQRQKYLAIYKQMAAKIATLQQEDGLWRPSLLDANEYPFKETSGSGFYCYSIAWGINQGILERADYLPVVKKAWAGLVNGVNSDGKLGYVQPVAAAPQSTDANQTATFGVGAFLLAGTEVYKLALAESNSTTTNSALQSDVKQAVAQIHPHPRLILTNERLAEIKEDIKHNKLRAACVQMVIRDANAMLTAPALEHTIIGPRMLHVSRNCLDRMYVLGLAWKLTGDERYARAMRDNLLTVCAFDDWNPSHFLDTAEMTHAVAIGYDWLFDWLDNDSKTRIFESIIKKGINPGIERYNTNANIWTVSRYNWNLVCNGGLIVGALAIADSNESEKALFILEHARRSMPIAISTYKPDGAWPEGIGYWGYATDYYVYAMDVLDTALGTDFGLSKNEGFAHAGDFPLIAAGPTGLTFNYADAGELSKVSLQPALFWLAKHFNKPEYAARELKLLSKKCEKDTLVHAELKPFVTAQPTVRDAIWWYEPNTANLPCQLKLDNYFGGEVEQAFMRSGWDDPNALFVAVKAGFNRVQHGHLDIGSFELDALGCRWVRDLGKDEYNLDGYWDSNSDGGKRWGYYRLGSLSHNVIVIDNNNQLLSGYAKIIKFQEGSEPLAVMDINSVSMKVDSMKRTVGMIKSRKAVIVQDDICLNAPATVTWQILTDANIACDKNKATLTIGSKKLIATIVSPAGAVFVANSAEQKPPQKINKGVSKLSFSIEQNKGNVTTAVLFSPVWPDGNVVSDCNLYR
jgi:rhamnogalacturonyl hydrolase YesR